MKIKFKKELSKETINQLKKNGFITVREYARKHGKSKWTVQRMCCEKVLPSRKVGGLWVIENK